MITSFFLQIAYSVFNFILSFLPNGEFPSTISTAFDFFTGIVATFNFILPVDTLFRVFLLVVIVRIALFQYGLAMYALRWVVGRNRMPH